MKEIPIVTAVNTHHWTSYYDEIMKKINDTCSAFTQGINQEDTSSGVLLVHDQYEQQAREKIEALGFSTNESEIELSDEDLAYYYSNNE